MAVVRRPTQPPSQGFCLSLAAAGCRPAPTTTTPLAPLECAAGPRSVRALPLASGSDRGAACASPEWGLSISALKSRDFARLRRTIISAMSACKRGDGRHQRKCGHAVWAKTGQSVSAGPARVHASEPAICVRARLGRTRLLLGEEPLNLALLHGVQVAGCGGAQRRRRRRSSGRLRFLNSLSPRLQGCTGEMHGLGGRRYAAVGRESDGL